MFLLGSDDLLRGGFADRLGEALAREAVPGRQNSVIESLSSCSLHLWWGGRVRSCAGRYLKLVSRVLRLYLSGCMVWWCLCVVCHGTGSAGPDLAAAAAVTAPAQYSTRYSQHSTGTQHSPLVTTSTTLLSKKTSQSHSHYCKHTCWLAPQPTPPILNIPHPPPAQLLDINTQSGRVLQPTKDQIHKHTFYIHVKGTLYIKL